MASVHSQITKQNGKIVALEGDADTISTQLRLLPPSQKILVLPSFLERLPQDSDSTVFNARAFIQDAHTAFTERTEIARAFLQPSTIAHPRLVLMNGGSITARATCISKICENLTGGSMEEAESLFNEIVDKGITGLMKPEESKSTRSDTENSDRTEDEEASEMGDIEEDPTSRAMKAADFLDRKTAILQAINEEIDSILTNCPPEEEDTQRSIYEEDLAEMPLTPTKSHIIKTDQHPDDIVRTTITIHPRKDARGARNAKLDPGFLISPFSAKSHYSRASSHQAADFIEDETDDEQFYLDLTSPSQQSHISTSGTPRIVYGEAYVFDVQSPSRNNSDQWIRKVKSVDRFQPSKSTDQVENFRSVFESGSRPRSSGDTVKTESWKQDFPLQRASLLRASKATIKRSHTISGSVRSIGSFKPSVRIYVDRGTDAAEGEPLDPIVSGKPSSEEITKMAFEPVFPLLEDLIIHFPTHTSTKVFDSVLQSYKNGNYPVIPLSSPDDESVPSLTTSNISIGDQSLRPQSHIATEMNDEFDSYPPHNGYSHNIKHWPSHKNSSMTDSTVQDLDPPTPSATPPPPPADSISNKFCELIPVNQNSAIGVQNSLRALLSLHFPAGENGYTQHYSPVDSEFDRLWKPVWRNEEHGITISEGRNIDLIMAFGCEDGVKKNFFDSISGQIERLGTKKDGLNRSARLDIRYLITIVMQTVTNQPLNVQNDFNPISNPSLLASLLVPHLEAYLAINTNVRFLILTYPANHLSTVIALRRLIGQDLFKVAGILDSLSSDPSSTVSRPRTPPLSHPLSNTATSSSLPYNSRSQSNSAETLGYQASCPTTKTSECTVSFSKANYLLPSIATDAEITNFISGIWTFLIEKSDYYTPEPEPEPVPVIVEKIVERLIEKPQPPPTPTSVTYRTHPKDLRDSKISRITGGDIDQPSLRKGQHYAASIASTARTTATERVRKERKNDEEWEDFYVGEVDSEDDAFDRMIMGRSGARIVPEVVKQVTGKKSGSKKALKWLGLA